MKFSVENSLKLMKQRGFSLLGSGSVLIPPQRQAGESLIVSFPSGVEIDTDDATIQARLLVLATGTAATLDGLARPRSDLGRDPRGVAQPGRHDVCPHDDSPSSAGDRDERHDPCQAGD